MATANQQLALAGRTALVTGASRGIGAGIAAALAREGARVGVGYREQRAAADAVVERLGGGARAFGADLTDAGQAARMVDEAVATFGGLDVLVLNAGVWRGGRLDELQADDWHLVIDSSLTAAYHVLRRALPALRESDRGRIVVVSSVIGVMGFPGDGAYATAKAGLLGLVRSLAKELGRHGVTVNAVAPGFVATDMTAAVSEKAREQMLSRTQIRRAGSVEDVAAAVRYLVCDGDYVTGQVLVVDGGLSL